METNGSSPDNFTWLNDTDGPLQLEAVEFSESFRVGLSIVLGTVFAVGVTGNLVTILWIALRGQPNNTMRTYVLSLSAADLAYLLGGPFYLSSFLMQPKWFARRESEVSVRSPAGVCISTISEGQLAGMIEAFRITADGTSGVETKHHPDFLVPSVNIFNNSIFSQQIPQRLPHRWSGPFCAVCAAGCMCKPVSLNLSVRQTATADRGFQPTVK
ncbi:hypothetical protein Bbelb_212780 [Branchiostoma belcheri]|nr:hypothetical protein Bbelb_212780 [Branchiostoma belcheri]